MVLKKTEVVHLYPSGVYKVSKARDDAEWPNMLLTQHGGNFMGYSLNQNPTFVRARPEEVEYFVCPACRDREVQAHHIGKKNGAQTTGAECQGCIFGTPAATPPLEETNRRMLAFANDPFPLSCAVPYTLEEKHSLGMVIGEEMQQSAQNKASRDQFGFSTQKAVMMLLLGGTLFFSLILGLAMWNTMFFQDGDSEPPAPPPAEPATYQYQGTFPPSLDKWGHA